ncbi:MAG: DUF899 domain-containing protein [Thermomicrobiales bacterium]
MATEVRTALPPVVSQQEWDTAREAFLVSEKAYMRAGDALNAERRRQPVVEITTPYTFESTNGPVTLLDLFGDRSQLVVYHFMFAPGQGEGCDGCSMIVDHMGPVQHLNARDTSLVLISRAPLQELLPYKQRMGWDQEWVSSFETSFNQDMGSTQDDGEHHMISVFVRDGDRIFRSTKVEARGGETFISTFKYLDLTPYGRQEEWEDSPAGWPKTEAYSWWKRHDEYEPSASSSSCCH